MKWKAKLAEVGLQEENLSTGLKNKIRDYYKIAEGLEDVKGDLEEADEEDIEEMQNDIEELTDALEDADNKLVRAIEIYDKNKEKYAEMSKRLKPKAKKQTTANSGEITLSGVTTAETKAAPIPEPTPVAAPAEVAADGGEVKEKKKSNGMGFVVIALFAGIVTLGVVNLYKSK